MAADRRSVLAAASVDLAVTLVFVLIGRASHGEGLMGVLGTWWPFLTGLVVGWIAARAWRRPLALWPTGVVVWLATVIVGVGLRAITGQGVEVSFVIVTILVLGGFLLGWRGIFAAAVGRRSRR